MPRAKSQSTVKTAAATTAVADQTEMANAVVPEQETTAPEQATDAPVQGEAAPEQATVTQDAPAEAPKATRTRRKANASETVNVIAVDDFTLDPAVQPRETLSTPLISEYADAMRAGADFPAVTVFRVGEQNVVVDGWHRVLAARQAQRPALEATVKTGTMREAILFSTAANATHGLRRTDADKRKAVLRLLNDDEWSKLSANQIAKIALVTQPFVSKLKRELGKAGGIVTTASGREMDTSNLGRPRQEPAAESVSTNGHVAVDEQPGGDAAVGDDTEIIETLKDIDSGDDDDTDDDEDTTPSLSIDDLLSDEEGHEELVRTPAQQFSAQLLSVIGKMASFDPERVFGEMAIEDLRQMENAWPTFIEQIDRYSEQLEQVLDARAQTAS